MKTADPRLATHIAGECQTLCTCLRVTLTNGEVYGFTDHSRDFMYEGVQFMAYTGTTPTATTSNASLSVDNVDFEILLDSPVISEADLVAGKWNHAAVEMFRVNYEDLTMGAIKGPKGYLGEIRLGKTSFTTEIRSLSQALQQNLGEVFSPTCRVKRFGDAFCKKDITALTFAKTIDFVYSSVSYEILGGGLTASQFAYGEIQFISGLNAGQILEIKDNGTTSIELQLPPTFEVQSGDAVILIAGCDRSLNACKANGNVINFRGEPYVPGEDKLLKGPNLH